MKRPRLTSSVTEILDDPATGRIIGSYTARRRMTETELKYARNFVVSLKDVKQALIESQRKDVPFGCGRCGRDIGVPDYCIYCGWTESQRKDETTVAKENKTEKTNMVFIAGTISKIDVREKFAWILVDCGGRSKIPMKCFERKLLPDLSRFEEGDFIKVHGMLNQSKNDRSDSWELLAVVTDIKCELPKRESKQAAAPAGYRPSKQDDDIPF